MIALVIRPHLSYGSLRSPCLPAIREAEASPDPYGGRVEGGVGGGRALAQSLS